MTESRERVLFLCTGNSARSQMAEGLLRHMAGDRFEVSSAGVRPKGIHPQSVAAMAESGIDISGHHSRHIDEFEGTHFDLVVTVCDHARESCPAFPGAARTLHWPFEDPSDAPGSEPEEEGFFLREYWYQPGQKTGNDHLSDGGSG